MQSLDRDHNKRVDFTEYLLMIFKLAQACNKIVGKDYCQASGSKQRDHNHQYQEEHSETEEEDDKEQESSSSCSSSSAGGNDFYSTGSRGSIKHRPKSTARKLRHQGSLRSSGNRQSSGERRKSSSTHFEDSEKNKYGSHQREISDSNESLGNKQQKKKSNQHHGFSSSSEEDYWSNSNESGCSHEYGSSHPSQKRWHISKGGSQSENCEEQGYCSNSTESSGHGKHTSTSGQSSSQRRRGSSTSGHSGSWKKQTHQFGSGNASRFEQCRSDLYQSPH
jgi:hypothetical protein